MVAAGLPEDGDLWLGPVHLRAGRRVQAGFGPSRRPVAWVTSEAVPEPGRVWARLHDARQQTGLLPFLIDYLSGAPDRPWDTEEFHEEPADPGEVGGDLDLIDVGELLEYWWDDQTNELDLADEDPASAGFLAAEIAPFARTFPGLAPPATTSLTSARLSAVLGALPPHRIGLVPATEAAEALPLVGWCPAGLPQHTLEVAAVVRSWADRFGVRMLKIGFADFSVLADRPPGNLQHARQLAAEQWAFCDEVGDGLSDINSISAYIMESPVWRFWWD